MGGSDQSSEPRFNKFLSAPAALSNSRSSSKPYVSVFPPVTPRFCLLPSASTSPLLPSARLYASLSLSCCFLRVYNKLVSRTSPSLRRRCGRWERGCGEKYEEEEEEERLDGGRRRRVGLHRQETSHRESSSLCCLQLLLVKLTALHCFNGKTTKARKIFAPLSINYKQLLIKCFCITVKLVQETNKA